MPGFELGCPELWDFPPLPLSVEFGGDPVDFPALATGASSTLSGFASFSSPSISSVGFVSVSSTLVVSTVVTTGSLGATAVSALVTVAVGAGAAAGGFSSMEVGGSTSTSSFRGLLVSDMMLLEGMEDHVVVGGSPIK